jgi:hypothetical protein
MKRVLDAESPVLRNRNSTETKGLGIGLLEPFNLTRKVPSDERDNNDVDSSSNFGDDLDSGNGSENLGSEPDPPDSPSEPPAKKRRLSLND